MFSPRWLTAALPLALALLTAAPASAQVPTADDIKSLDGPTKLTIRKGIKYLISRQDKATGAWGEAHTAPGLTALALLALVRCPDKYDDSDPFFRAPIDYLLKLQKKNGGIYKDMLGNYITSVSLLAFCEIKAKDRCKDKDRKAKVAAAIAKARDYLIELQADEGEGYTKQDKMYGGVGYGGDMRPDLSNTQLALEAAKAAGVKSDDAFMKKALVFLKRCQNRGESNDQPWSKIINDGGFIYYPGKTYAKNGKVEGKDGVEGFKSYGSMTYAGVKSYIYAGVKWDDPMVKSAMGWIAKHYTVKEHPNAGKQGYYYYLHTFAKTMALHSAHTKSSVLEDADGRKHNWRYDLAKHLGTLQLKDGAWRNADNGRWMEGDEVLATTYAVLALNYCYPLGKKAVSAKKPGEKPAEKKPAEKPAEKKPAEKPAEKKPAEKKPAEKPAEKKPAEKPAEKKPAEKPAK